MTRVIVDASVVLAWLLSEDRPAWVESLIDQVRAGKVHIAVPALFWLEIGNRFARDRTLTDVQAMDGMLHIESIGFETRELDRPLRLRALQLGRTTHLSMYDATYLALAHALTSPLATLDRHLDDAASSIGLSYANPGRRLAEEATTYGAESDPESDPVSLASIGAGLAELRRLYATI